MTQSTLIFHELYDKMLPNLIHPYALLHSDILRLSLNLSGSPFGEECVYYRSQNKSGIKYPFMYKKTIEKTQLRRLFYYNFVGNPNNLYLTTKCGNNCCCCIKHIKVKPLKDSKNKRRFNWNIKDKND